MNSTAHLHSTGEPEQKLPVGRP